MYLCLSEYTAAIQTQTDVDKKTLQLMDLDLLNRLSQDHWITFAAHNPDSFRKQIRSGKNRLMDVGLNSFEEICRTRFVKVF